MVYLLYIVHVYVYTYVIFAEIQILQIISYTKKKSGLWAVLTHAI